MNDLTNFARLIPLDKGLCVISTSRRDGTIQSSVVNAGVLPHPLSGDSVIGVVSFAASRKVANLKARPAATIVARAGWDWAAAEGSVEVLGPGDSTAVSGEQLRVLFRDVFTAAGGTHDDWDAYDRAMIDEGRVVILIAPTRVYTNG